MKCCSILTLCILLLMIGLPSCQDSYDNNVSSDKTKLTPEGKLRIPVKLLVSSFDDIKTRSADKSTDEKKIYNICVFVLEASSADGFSESDRLLQCSNVELADVNNIQEQNNVAYIELWPYAKSCRILILANYSTETSDLIKSMIVTGADNSTPTTWKEIKKLELSLADLYKDPLNPGGDIDNLTLKYPMSSGALYLNNISEQSTANMQIPLSACFARIDLSNSSTSDFKVKSVSVVAAETNASYWSSNVQSDAVISDKISYIPVQSDPNTQIVRPIYLLPSARNITNSESGNVATDLIICGDYTDRYGKQYSGGFYKLRIKYTDSNGSSYDINRNTLYYVDIKDVKGPGYTTSEEAVKNSPANVLYDITVDDKSKDVFISNGEYYLGLSNSSCLIYADEVTSFTVAVLSHNLPSTVTNATITIVGEGVTLVPSQTGLSVAGDGKSAIIDKSISQIPLKVNLAASSKYAKIILRLGNLEKEFLLERRAALPATGGTINLEEFGQVISATSYSDRVSCNPDNTLLVHDQKYSKELNKVFSNISVFCGDGRGNALISVMKHVQEAVYYEKYSDNSYGFYFKDGLFSTINNGKEIVETGYGIVNLKGLSKANIAFDGRQFSSSRIVQNSLFEDYSNASFYPVSQDLIPAQSAFKASAVSYDSELLSSFIYPNNAKGVYSANLIDQGTAQNPLVIRTPLQLKRINSGNNSKYFKQECDINFSKTRIGGSASFSSSIVGGDFTGVYDGNGKLISDLKLNNTTYSSLALFSSNKGTLKNMRLLRFTIDGGASSSCLAGINRGNIEQVLIASSKIQSYGEYAGAVAGHNYTDGKISDCMVTGNSSLGYVVYGYNYVGAITGCNHEGSKGISNVCVVDLNPKCATAFVHSPNTDQNTGGIVGRNDAEVINGLYIAKAPYWDDNYPIDGNGSKINLTQNCFFLKGFNASVTDYGNSSGYTMTGFANVLNLPVKYWTFSKDYPYPQLISFSVPQSWPGKLN